MTQIRGQEIDRVIFGSCVYHSPKIPEEFHVKGNNPIGFLGELHNPREFQSRWVILGVILE